MQGLLISLFGALAGSMLFFALAVAPTVFRSLPPEHAGSFLRALFPRYYLWGIVVAVACTLSAWIADSGAIAIGVCVAVLALFIYARQFLMPAINRARDRDLEGDAQASASFRALHLQSVLINALQLILLVAASAYLMGV